MFLSIMYEKSVVDKHLEAVSHKKMPEKQGGAKQKLLRHC